MKRAMVFGMIPMAPVIGGLIFATFATPVFVPIVHRLLRRAARPAAPPTEGGRHAITY